MSLRFDGLEMVKFIKYSIVNAVGAISVPVTTYSISIYFISYYKHQ